MHWAYTAALTIGGLACGRSSSRCPRCRRVRPPSRRVRRFPTADDAAFGFTSIRWGTRRPVRYLVPVGPSTSCSPPATQLPDGRLGCGVRARPRRSAPAARRLRAAACTNSCGSRADASSRSPSSRAATSSQARSGLHWSRFHRSSAGATRISASVCFCASACCRLALLCAARLRAKGTECFSRQRLRLHSRPCRTPRLQVLGSLLCFPAAWRCRCPMCTSSRSAAPGFAPRGCADVFTDARCGIVSRPTVRLIFDRSAGCARCSCVSCLQGASLLLFVPSTPSLALCGFGAVRAVPGAVSCRPTRSACASISRRPKPGRASPPHHPNLLSALRWAAMSRRIFDLTGSYRAAS